MTAYTLTIRTTDPRGVEQRLRDYGHRLAEELSEGGCPTTWRTSADEGCEGFTNYATSSIALVVDNDAQLLDQMRARVLHAIEHVFPAEWPDDQNDGELCAGTVARVLHDWADETAPDDLPTFWGSILRAGLGDVDWSELARHYINDLAEYGARRR